MACCIWGSPKCQLARQSLDVLPSALCHRDVVVPLHTGRCPIPSLLCLSPLQVKFVKSGSVAIVQISVEKAICVETFSDVPQVTRSHFGRFPYLCHYDL